MNAERSLQIIAAATACMGTAMLGIGEENYALVLAAVVVSVGALVLCDIKKWFHLNNTGSNIAAIFMLALAVVQLQNSEFEQRILVMADLLGYLQFVLQFRLKTARNYWLLLLVSFLQTCVAAALHTGVAFGVMLTMYLFSGTFFLGYFFFVREQGKFDKESLAAKKLIEKRGYGFFGKTATQQPSDSLSSEFSRRMTGIVFGTIALSVIFFIAVPRVGQSNWSPAGIVGDRTVGFSSEINLSRSGEIIEDPEEVMQVRFFDAKTNLPYQVDGELYMRGTSVSHYADGRWERGTRGAFLRPGVPMYVPDPSGGEMIRQTVTIEPLSSITLFSTAPAFAASGTDSTSSMMHNSIAGQLARKETLRVKRFQYELIVPGIAMHKQLNLVPLTYDLGSPDLRQAFREMLRLPNIVAGQDSLRGLKEIAASIVADLPADRLYERAKRLEAYLRDSGRFSYSLDAEERPKGIDPLEDFVTNRPHGHCEFFAGALALMLRSVNIPARVVLGYRGGEYNVVGSFYQFQQLHAHSWVEAYMPPANIPVGRFPTEISAENAERFGAWLQLDGTPGAAIAQASANESRWFELIQMSDYIRFLWSNYVVGMDAMRQQESIYQPLGTGIDAVSYAIFSSEAWNERWSAVKTSFDPSNQNFGRALSYASIVFGAGILVIAAFIAGPKIFRRGLFSRSLGGPAAKGTARSSEVDFYRSFEKVLKNFDCARTGSQTQREFATTAGDRLARSPNAASLVALPQLIVDAYYRVRFGKQDLDASERREVETALHDLNNALDK